MLRKPGIFGPNQKSVPPYVISPTEPFLLNLSKHTVRWGMRRQLLVPHWEGGQKKFVPTVPNGVVVRREAQRLYTLNDGKERKRRRAQKRPGAAGGTPGRKKKKRKLGGKKESRGDMHVGKKRQETLGKAFGVGVLACGKKSGPRTSRSLAGKSDRGSTENGGVKK